MATTQAVRHEDLLARLVVGHSPAIEQVRERIRRAARSDLPVLILGETGAGKEVVARAIHQLSGLNPFVVVDCSALVENLIESELFGFVKGAFTGATTSRKGLLEQADGGIVFFDEIGELPLDLQAKLLRVLQEKELRPLGSNTVRKVNFRVMAATNRDLAEEVRQGHFREDLYYRLKVVTIRVPPLRERREDIPLLVEHFLRQIGGRYTVPADLMNVLVSYDWPGNVRELRNCLEVLVAQSEGSILSARHLPSPVQNFLQYRYSPVVDQPTKIEHPAEPLPGDLIVHALDRLISLEELEKLYIEALLKRTRRDKTLTARILGISRTTLYRKLKRYGLEH